MTVTIRTVLLSLAVASVPPAAARATTVTILDPTLDVDDPVSMAVGADGRAWIAYYATATGDLKLARCADVACTSAAISTLDAAGDVGRSPALAIGADGRPVIAYVDATTPALKIAHCDDPACASATRSAVDPVVVGETSLAIGADGLPLVAYTIASGVKAVHCSVPDCTRRSIHTIGTSGGVGISIVITDGLGLVALGGSNGLRIRRCTDVECSAATPAAPERPLGFPITTVRYPALAVPPDGRALVSFHAEVTKGGFPVENYLRLSRCDDASCTQLPDSQTVGFDTTGFSAVAVRPDGLGWFAFTAGATRLRACTSADCLTYTQTCANLQATRLALSAAGDGASLLAFRRTDGAVGVAYQVDGDCPLPQLAVVDAAGVEQGPSPARFSVFLSELAASPVTVSYATTDDTAIAGLDYVASSGTITFPTGSSLAIVSVPALDDDLDEPSEYFTMDLTGPIGAVLADGHAQGRIVDDDEIRLRVEDTTAPEGDTGSQGAPVSVSFLEGSSTFQVTVGYSTQPVTATPGVDYLPVTGTVTFPPGATTATFSVPILGDTGVELDETLKVSIGGAVNAFVAVPDALVTIQDDDAPSLSSIELTHGTSLTADLAAQAGPAPDVDHYRLSQSPRASYEVTADAVSGDLSPGLVLELLAEDNATVLRSSVPVGTGGALALRWEHGLDTTHTSQTVRVRGASCGTACGADDTYRLTLRETTGSVARFNNSATQVTVLLLQNTTDQPLAVHAHFWNAAGQRIATTDNGPMPPHGVAALNTGAVAALAGRSGSITVSHDGPYGALAGKAVSIEPGTGFTFDSPLVYRPH